MKIFYNSIGQAVRYDLNDYHLCIFCNKYIKSKNIYYHNLGVKHNINVKQNKNHDRLQRTYNGMYEKIHVLPDKQEVIFNNPVFILKSCIKNK